MPRIYSTPTNTIIAIPSYQRADWHVTKKPRTANHISKTYWPATRYYVEPTEVQQYRAMLKGTGGNVFNAAEAEVQGMWGSIMDHIIDQCSKQCEHIVIMDDDLALAYRPNLPAEPTRYEKMTEPLFDEMIEELSLITTEQMPLCSTQYRQFSNGKSGQFQHNQRISMIWSLNAKFFREHPEFRFYRESRLHFMADYYFFLKLLLCGYPSMCINRFTKDDQPNAPGGIQANAKMQVFNDCVRRFQTMFPQHVKVREKQGKTHWKDGMLGVTIYAAKALGAGLPSTLPQVLAAAPK